MAQQTILFTVMPRGVQVNPGALRVSVLVAPRLSGAEKLGEFPDWLNWTSILKEKGLRLTFRCGTRTTTLAADTAPLRPELWKEMFNEGTFVRPYTFDDYTGRAIFSYPTRLALSTIKAAYQEAGLALGLPEQEDGQGRDDKYHSRSREVIKNLLAGFAIDWNEALGNRLRQSYRSSFAQFGASGDVLFARYDPASLAPDGTLNNLPAHGTSASANLHSFVAAQFAVYSHMPQGAPVHENPPDFDTLIDFHQALSTLNSYPELLRALGLVLDFDLPATAVALTPPNLPDKMAVVDAPGRNWQISTSSVPRIAPLETAYLYFAAGSGPNAWRVFTTAPALLGGELPDLEILGLLNLDPGRYGAAQVDVESGMHKTTLLAESWQDDRPGPAFPAHPEVFDESTTLPALRSGGFSIFADGRALRLLKTLQENKKFNESLEGGAAPKRPFYAEDLVHGYRLDVWDSFSEQWHSLHLRRATYTIGDQTFKPAEDVEGFLQLAAGQATPDPANPPPNDLYLNESITRWNGWSLSVPFPGKALSRDPDPAKALTSDPDHPENEAATPFKMSTHFTVAPKSLPALRFGRRYRLRLRGVDVCGNSMAHNDPLAHLLSFLAGLPRDPEGFAYLRYEPVAAPGIVLRDAQAVTAPGSQLTRLVIRTRNTNPEQDADPADLTASDRFIVPPSTSVEVGERLGMFDGNGKLDTSPAMYDLIAQRDQGKLNHVEVEVAGQLQSFPLESGEALDALPYLPDVLARGAALRNLPGAPEGSLGVVAPGAGMDAPAPFEPLADANPRRGSAVLVGFGGQDDWQALLPFRLALGDGSQPPHWDAQNRVLTVFLPKGHLSVVPLSSYLLPDDLKRMGVWQWLREAIDLATVKAPDAPKADPRFDMEKIAHLLQRAVEGGHWMITPPTLLTLVHAVQQPIGTPAFTPITAQHETYGTEDAWGTLDENLNIDPTVLQTAPEAAPTASSEMAPITAWRKLNSPEAFLLGGLVIHAASTEKVDLLAEWTDPVDDPSKPRLPGETYTETNTTQADKIEITSLQEGYLATGSGANFRMLAFYDADHGLLCFTRRGDRLGNLQSGQTVYSDAAPRHYFNDTRYHRVAYTARATSRFREYFPQDEDLDFTRQSQPVIVDVPASARPAAAQIDYVIPTFGWQRQVQTNLKRSIRFGGGLRIYIERPWFSSGEGELLGVLLYDYRSGSLTDREAWKPYVTQWGADPIWNAEGLPQLPQAYHFLNAAASEYNLSLPGRVPGRVGVAGFPVAYDFERQKWFADLTIDTQTMAYTPFLRLALCRYQPFALVDAKLSAPVLVDYIQLTPDRSAVVTADPYHPRHLRVTLSGPAPAGPAPLISGAQPTEPVAAPTRVVITVQRRDPAIQSDLGWEDAPAGTAVVSPTPVVDASGRVRWTGTVSFTTLPEPGQVRLLIQEYEYLSANYTVVTPGRRGAPARREQPSRLIYAETVELDTALIGAPTGSVGTQPTG